MLSLILFTGLAGLDARAADDFDVKAVFGSNEQQERAVDAVAGQAQESAITKLKALLKKYRGMRQEPILLSRLADFQSQDSAIKFRLAHGAKGKKAQDAMAAWRKSQKTTIATLNELIAKYPRFEEVSHAYFLRGKSYEELGEKSQATADYLHLVKNYPDSEETLPAYMSLAEFAIQANDHPKAISYLMNVEKRPDSPFFPFALYKLSWSHYNLKQIPVALSFAERHVQYYNDRRSRNKGEEVASDAAFRENMLMDAALFYMEGYEQKLPQYALDKALDYFRKLEKGPVLGRMLVKYAKLLRSHGYDEDLNRWKKQILDDESARPESVDAVVVVFEHQVNKRRFKDLEATAKDFIALYPKHAKYEGFPRAQKLLLDTAEQMQQLVIKNKKADGVQELSVTLAVIYDAFTRVVPESDPRIPRVHYNLAETLFEIKDYEKATAHYRWVVEHGTWDKAKVKEQASVWDASLKAIGARYEHLHEKNLIPKDIVAKPMETEPSGKPDPLLTEWIGWVDTHMEKTNEGIENFYFESNRCLYSLGYVAKAFDRMRKFAMKNPGSKFAVPSATLALDTEITGQKWERVQDLANELAAVKGWKDAEFGKRLVAVASDALFKIVERHFHEREFKQAWSRADEFLKRYPGSKRLPDTLYLAGGSALALNDRKAAVGYYSRLIAEAPKAETVPAALTARSQIAEDRYEFGPAARDARAYLETQAGKAVENGEALRRKTLMMAWLSGEPAELRAALASKSVCTEKLEQDCSRYQALSMLQTLGPAGQLDSSTTELALGNAKKAEGANQAVWAAVALQGAQHLEFRERLRALRMAASTWEETDPLVRFSLVPHLSRSMPAAFHANRLVMDKEAPLRANPKWIQRRIEVIREMENVATKMMKLSWSRVRAAILSENADLYLDLSKGIAALPAPKDLSEADQQAYEDTIRKIVIPFEEKGQEMRNKAFEIASRFAIDEDAFAAVAEPFFRDNPSLAKSLQPEKPFGKPAALDLALLDRLDPKGDWDDLDPKASERGDYLKALWAAAVKDRKWGQVGFFMQEASEKALLSPVALALVKAASLAAAGAKGEGLAELEAAIAEMKGDQRKHGLKALLSHYLASFSKERSQKTLKAYQDELAKENPEAAAQAEAARAAEKASAKAEAGKPSPRKPASRSASEDVIAQAQQWIGG